MSITEFSRAGGLDDWMPIMLMIGVIAWVYDWYDKSRHMEQGTNGSLSGS